MPGSRSTPEKGRAASVGPRAAMDTLLAGNAGGTLRRALWLDSMDQLLRPHLPRELAAHARLANVRGSRLVFVVDAPLWHARLRLATPTLLDAARSLGLEVDDVGIRVTPRPLRPLPPVSTPSAPMSAAARSGLAAALALLRDDAVDDRAAPRPGSAEGAS